MNAESQPDDEVEVKFTGNIRRLRLKPGDKLVLEVPPNVSVENVEALVAAMASRFPDNQVIVLGGGVRAAAVISAPAVSIAQSLGVNGFTTHR